MPGRTGRWNVPDALTSQNAVAWNARTGRPGRRTRGRGPVTGAEDTAEFARRLRELKDRSGRSYGMLAKRLHMSTSTLHRYCNGDAVPAEYAPVERFARVCGASTEELVSLHRAWVLADAARRRPAPAPAPAPESTAGGAAGAAGGAPGTRAAAEAASGSAPPGAVSATEADRADGTPAADAPAVSAAATGAPVAGATTPNDAPTADTRALGAVTPDARTPDTPADAPGKGSTPAHSPATHQAGTAAAAAVPPKAGAGPEATGPKAEGGTGPEAGT
ncbi:helix-turn-helix domain-containing protein, partial [Streptomyces sp. CO7]